MKPRAQALSGWQYQVSYSVPFPKSMIFNQFVCVHTWVFENNIFENMFAAMGLFVEGWGNCTQNSELSPHGFVYHMISLIRGLS